MLEAHHLEAMLAMVRWHRGDRERATQWMKEQRVTPDVTRVLMAGAWDT